MQLNYRIKIIYLVYIAVFLLSVFFIFQTSIQRKDKAIITSKISDLRAVHFCWLDAEYADEKKISIDALLELANMNKIENKEFIARLHEGESSKELKFYLHTGNSGILAEWKYKYVILKLTTDGSVIINKE